VSDDPLSSYIPGFLVARRYSPASRRQRTTVVSRFCSFVGDPAPGDLTSLMCLEWWATVADRKPATATTYLRAVQQFLLHLREFEVLDHDPLKSIRPPKPKRLSPRVLTPDEVARVLAVCASPRDRCVASLMLGSGLRSVDVASLRIEDIDLEAGLMVVHGKGGHSDLAPMPAAVIEAVRGYLDVAPATEGPLIRPLHGASLGQRPDPSAPLAASTVEHRMLSLMLKAGVKRARGDGRGPHAMRRTFATTLLENGASVREVQMLLRHQSLSSTEHYLRRPEAAQMRSVIETGPLSQSTTKITDTIPGGNPS